VARCAFIILFAGLALGCDRPNPFPAVEREVLERGVVHLQTSTDTIEVDVEIAQSNSARAYGLMDRDHLGSTEGMLFVFEEDRSGEDAFHMFRTRIPLDIAFADADGLMVSLMTMQPCDSPVAHVCWKYAPGAPYRLALEVNGGYFASKNVAVGDRLHWVR
jgi:hypothetical protein